VNNSTRTITATAITADVVAAELARARTRTLDLLAPIGASDQQRQVSNLMSPLCWDLAHIAHYEELWLLRKLVDEAPTDPRFDDLYDAFKHPRRERVTLPILSPDDARSFAADVRTRVRAILDRLDLDDPRLTNDNPLLADAFVYGMVVQHEHQHIETMLATIQLMSPDFAHPAGDVPAGSASPTVDPAATCAVRGGPVTVGTSTTPWAYDNERPAHTVELAPFLIDRYPVSNGRYLEFVADGGYQTPACWSETGWAWRQEAGLTAPEFWQPEGSGSWSRLRFGRQEDLPLAEPVQHVGFHEASAFARWAGARLPTELEWEAAAAGASLGAANLGQQQFAPRPIGAVPQTASAWGAEQLFGDVWEWTSSPFAPYPGFAAFPYREYSEVFFGDEYFVLRGGSWATDAVAVRPTFRNWDYPIRRQIFSGFRCARDA
jgi:gamma-glutamyl hercynylcysteine S-oxide synthase